MENLEENLGTITRKGHTYQTRMITMEGESFEEGGEELMISTDSLIEALDLEDEEDEYIDNQFYCYVPDLLIYADESEIQKFVLENIV